MNKNIREKRRGMTDCLSFYSFDDDSLGNPQFRDHEDERELQELEANIQAYQELKTNILYFNQLDKECENEVATWFEESPNAVVKLIVESVYAALQSFAEKRAKMQMTNVNDEILFPTDEDIIIAVESEIVNQSNWDGVHEEGLTQKALEEWREDWV